MKHELSILIPTFNDLCEPLVRQICQQADKLAATKFCYEVIVADDASTDFTIVNSNATISQIPHCRLIRQEQNIGRSAIRNMLAREASYQWLLFIDGDMRVRHHNFLEQYIITPCETVVYGGYELAFVSKSNLRSLYEKSCLSQHTVAQRQIKPYKDFHTSNFMVSRHLFLEHPLNEKFRYYGYEDVVWGMMLGKLGVDICHIDNPVCFESFESNSSFMKKTEEALCTLHQFCDMLKDDSKLITLANLLKFLKYPLSWIFNLLAPSMRRSLCGSRPSLWMFNLYRLGFYLSL
jgi:glycosyltransferase involved in cell wall biosynthesis